MQNLISYAIRCTQKENYLSLIHISRDARNEYERRDAVWDAGNEHERRNAARNVRNEHERRNAADGNVRNEHDRRNATESVSYTHLDVYKRQEYE